MIEFKDKTAVVLGAARQGQALARYAFRHGAKVIVTDAKSFEQLAPAREALKDVNPEWVCGGHPLELLDRADMVLITGGADLRIPFLKAAREKGVAILNDASIFLHEVKTPIIAITGSSGKTTTTTLVGRMANAFANQTQEVWIGGNIGYALMNFIDDIRPNDIVVLELSSFQLELVKDSPHVAAILNITPNHLDRHETMENYTNAKANIMTHQKAGDIVVLGRDNPICAELAKKAPADCLTFGFSAPNADEERTIYLENETIYCRDHGTVTPIMKTDAIQLRGRHNVSNVMAACAIAYAAGFSFESMRAGVEGFKGVDHRLQWVRKYHGANWYNDSIATAPERTMAALHSFDEPLILLLGGRDKKLPWGELAAELQKHTRYAILFGEAAGLIEDALKKAQTPNGPIVIRCETLEEAVKAAGEVCAEGDAVLLSPGGTSYDAFTNFEERGDKFTEWVKALN